MESLVDIFIILISFIVLIGLIVGIHELGHFLTARFFGIHVIRFKIGFGKTFFKFLDNKGTEFSLGVLPFGGYVQMLGEQGYADDDSYHESDNQRKFSYSEASHGARALITFAGPLANFLLAIVAYFFIFMMGVKDLQPIVGSIESESLAYKAGLKVGDRILSIDGNSVHGFRDLNILLASRMGESGEIVLKIKEDGTGLESSRSVQITNWLDYQDEKSPTMVLGIGPFIPALVTAVQKAGPADIAGIKKGDFILEVNNVLVKTWADLSDQISKYPLTSIELKVERDKQIFNVSILTERISDKEGFWKGKIGIRGVSNVDDLPKNFIFLRKSTPLKAFSDAVNETYKFTILILGSIGKMLSGSISTENIGGPIQISLLAGAAMKSGLVSFLSMTAIISINLGLINLFPIPILDGGQILLIAVEKIKGSPISKTFLDILLRLGLLFIIGLMLFAVFNDFSRIF